MSLQTIILMGRAGSGKGTQGALLKSALEAAGGKVLYLETGSKFREFVAGTSYSSLKAREVIMKGKLMPSFLAVWAWGSSMLEQMTGDEHIIVDGTPRMMGEALLFNEALQFYGRSPIIFVHLNVPAEEVTKRLTLRARADDSAEGINNRLKAFEQEVVPVIEYFKTAPGVTFVEVDGHQTIEAVQAEIKSKLSLN